MMTTLLARMARHGMAILAACMGVGLVLPGLAHAVVPLLTPTIWAMLVLTMMRVDWGQVLAHMARPGRIALVLAFDILLVPVAAWALAPRLGAPGALADALVLMGLTTPLMSSPALALLLGLDASLALVVMVPGVLLMPVVLPVMALELLGLELGVDVLTLMGRLALLLGSALIVAAAARRLLGTERLGRLAVPIDGGMVILLVVFAIAIMDGITARLLQDPWLVIGYVVLSFAVNALLQAIGALVFLRLGARSALTVGLGAGNRGMALLLPVLPAETDPDTMIYFVLGQIPIYMLPALLAPVYRRLTPPGRP